MSRKIWQRGDIVVASFAPTLGQERQGRRPGIVVTHADLSVSLMGTGTQTQGVVLVHQFRMIDDPSQRGLTLIEQAPDDLVEEVRARVAAMLD